MARHTGATDERFIAHSKRVAAIDDGWAGALKPSHQQVLTHAD
jgi:hypothetical protein